MTPKPDRTSSAATTDSRIELIHNTLTRLSVAYPGPEDANEAHAALREIAAENERLRGALRRGAYLAFVAGYGAATSVEEYLAAANDGFDEWWERIGRIMVCGSRPLPAPGMTDLMVTPESIDAYLDKYGGPSE